MEETNYKYDDRYYDPEKKRNPIINVIKVVLIVLAVFIVIILLTKACGAKINYNDLLEAGKQYYSINDDELPQAKGACSIVTLKTLKEGKLLGDKQYKTCDNEKTNVKICILADGSRQYTPVLSCGKTETTFEEWKDGEISDLIADSSDVQFTFKGSIKGTKMYYPKNLTDASKVIEYYTASPAAGYTNKDDENKAVSKYYSTTAVKAYWNGGAPSATQPAGYPNSDTPSTITVYSPTKPSGASESLTIYRTQTLAHVFKYACTDSKHSGIKLTSTPCSKATDGFTAFVTDKFTFTCGVKDKNGAMVLVPIGTACSNNYSSWGEKVCKTDLINGIKCESQPGYKYTTKTYRWYKNVSSNSYYPSLSTDVNKEKTYYASAPNTGYTKNASTTTTGYKFYKLVDKDGNIIEKSANITEDFVSEEDFIKAVNDAGYDVSSLKDIAALEDVEYEITMQYRNRID